jgi:hypothetical protein
VVGPDEVDTAPILPGRRGLPGLDGGREISGFWGGVGLGEPLVTGPAAILSWSSLTTLAPGAGLAE